jgi:hypothetical protein
MPGNIHAQTPQLLNQSPHLGSAGPDFVRNLGAAGDNGSVIHQEPNNASQAHVRSLMRGRRAASFGRGGDGRNYSGGRCSSFAIRPSLFAVRRSLFAETRGRGAPRTV